MRLTEIGHFNRFEGDQLSDMWPIHSVVQPLPLRDS